MADLLRNRWLRRGIALVVGLAVVGGGYVAYAAHDDRAGGYRTAVVAKADVTQTLDLSGTVTPLGRSDLEFGTSGTVAWVAPVGTKVKRGQAVARLDLSTLRDAVEQAQARVDSAQARLASDEATRTTELAAIAEQAKEEAAAKAAAAQKQAGSRGASSASHADPVALAEQACAGSGGSSGSSGSGSSGSPGGSSGKPSSGASTGAAPSGQAGAMPSGQASAAARTTTTKTSKTSKTGGAAGAAGSGATTCAQALAEVEQYVAGLTKQLQSQGSSATSRTTAGSSGLSASRSGGTTSAVLTVTTASLAQDRATIASARSDLVSAQAELRDGTLRAPAAGRVADTDVAAGDSASTGSTAVTVLGKGLTTVTMDVSDTQVRELKVGQKASVLPPGAVAPLAGSVTRIGDVPDSSSSSSTTTYPVVVTLDRTNLSLLAGTTASVTVDVGTARDALTVPTSAVQDDTVEVLRNGTPESVRVTTGVTGPTRTQITQGLAAGDRVVLADLSESIPTDDTQTTRFGGGLSGGFSGRSGFSGGFSGAGLSGGFGGRG